MDKHVEIRGAIAHIPLVTAAFFLAVTPVAAQSGLEPIRLHAGVNRIPNIAGDGKDGVISLDWVENGNAWSHDLFTVKVGGSIASIAGANNISDSPHVGADMVTSVRFARGRAPGRQTTIALVARRDIVTSVPGPAQTMISVYVLGRNTEPFGTPYRFVQARAFRATRLYCNADMALKTELGFPLARTYEGRMTMNGC